MEVQHRADPGEPGAESWGGDPNTPKHGGNLWTPMSLDVEKGLLYVPVGNPAPDFYEEGRPGRNLYTNAIVALDVRTGKLAWYYQAVPHDVRDYDLTHVAPIFTTTIGGQQRTVIGLTGKDGLLRVFDRDARKVLYSVPFTTRENAEGPLGPSFTHVCPGLLGGHEWNGAAYSGSALCSCRRPIGATRSDQQRSRPTRKRRRSEASSSAASSSSIPGPTRGA